MDFSLLLTIIAAAIGFILIFGKLRSHHENEEFDSTSLSTSSTPSSLSISSVSPSSSSHVWLHDVFPSFRGEDVRYNFLSHIKKEFKRKTITFFNDNAIERGESIAPELMRGIRASKIAIVLLSANYASSKWCLEELVEIMKCNEELGQTVIAIFYKVDPSDVKKVNGDFGKVFKETCKGQAKEDIRRWKQALEKVAVIAGYHLSNWDDEATVIEDISTRVLNKLINSPKPSHFDNLIGMSTHMEKMEPFLLLGSNEVRMIGIWGPSGIGKSTIARVLFNQHSHQFPFSVFMENIKRLWPRPYYDEYSVKLQLQEEFLSRIINQKDIKIQQLGVVEDRLKDKRVLAILDDVDHSLQIDAIAKEARWFGPGSRIIITTQDKRLLNAHMINHIYEVELPPDAEALEIFCTYAFCQKSPPDGFKQLAWEVTKLAGKLPLGLRVMGSYFKGKPKHEWEEELPTLISRLDGEIESILKFSYDALWVDDQALFLHLCCFFNVQWRERVEYCLAKNFVGVKSRLRILAEKSFISVDDGYIRIHDLLARLGTEIVRKQSIHEPGKRQFLVDVEDICQILRNDTLGSQSVIGINLELRKLGAELKISDGAFERMPNVQFLRVDSGKSFLPYHPDCRHYSVDMMTCLPQNLKLLHWDSFPMTWLSSNFNPESLVEIILRESNSLEKLWEGNKTIRNLKLADLSHSRNLNELPDLSTATNLQTLDLSGCSSLVELPFSIGNAINLITLDLNRCSSLVGIPSSIWNLVNLETLDLSYCSSLVRLPSSSGNAIIKLESLKLGGCTSLMELPSSMENATNLEELDLTGCLHLAKLPSSMGNLKKLYLKDCQSLVELPSSVINSLNLKSFDFEGCSNLVELPFHLGNATDLREIDLSGCSSLRELPSSIEKMSNLQDLYLNGCSSLVELPSSIRNMKPLDILSLTGCSLMKSFPEIPPNTGVLDLTGTGIEEIPPSLMSWPRLRELHISYFENLRNFQHAFDCITHLYLSDARVLEISPCVKEMSRLRELVIEGCTKLVSLPKLPESLKLLVSDNCESLERLDCSFYKTEFNALSFINCFKLSQEARDLIVKTPTGNGAVFPGEKVPTYFTYRATGSSLSMNLNGLDTHFPTSLRFKACVLLVNNKPDDDEGGRREISYSIKDRQNGHQSGYLNLLIKLNPAIKEHLLVFETEATVSSPELVFEFSFSPEKWEIEECGLRPLETLAPSC